MEILYSNGDSLIIRNNKGKMQKIPKNKFEKGEIVMKGDKHYSKDGIVRLLDPTWTDTRGWIYGENYIDLHGSGGGCRYSTNEDCLKKIDIPAVRLYAKRINLNTEIANLEKLLKDKKIELEKVEYGLSISVDKWKDMKKVCRCGNLFIRNSKNINWDHCDKCNHLDHY